MTDGLVFPNPRSCLFDLIDGDEHLGDVVHAFYQEPANELGAMEGPFPIAIIYAVPGGSEGFVDRVDRMAIDVYAPGEKAVDTLESIKASICGDDIETPSGYIDNIKPDQVPTDIPYQSDILNKATATFLMTSRPI
ncbi:hypothetical protein [Arthrobacter glacialis]|uniref:hypothetical protein n=1 Tax=Arthrobacter glacialis TaxID=1664 RepID=UPI000CD42D77|nr:hypothetical protein [Arthrobacter glacialis]POH58919.1 hypothetical protein CVS28_09430 [Arthrobacter glacialis]